MSDNKKKAWTVITPAGNIYVDTASEAYDYKNTYGFAVVRTKQDDYE